MKKTAAILLFIFTLVQAAPAIHSLYADTMSFFIADEEKNNDKTDPVENKGKKDCALFLTQSETLSQKLNTAFHLAEKIQTSPCLEMITPPPNFC